MATRLPSTPRENRPGSKSPSGNVCRATRRRPNAPVSAHAAKKRGHRTRRAGGNHMTRLCHAAGLQPPYVAALASGADGSCSGPRTLPRAGDARPAPLFCEKRVAGLPFDDRPGRPRHPVGAGPGEETIATPHYPIRSPERN
jgi:hypothetical protein